MYSYLNIAAPTPVPALFGSPAAAPTAMPLQTSTFSHIIAAQLYSQLTGVLAGFALSALVVVVSAEILGGKRSLNRRRKLRRVAEPLLAAFVGLVACSLTYAVVAADGDSTRTSIEHIIVGGGFFSSAIPLLLAVVTLLELSVDGISSIPRFMVGRVIPVVAIGYILAGVNDFAIQTQNNAPLGFAWIGALIVLIFAVSPVNQESDANQEGDAKQESDGKQESDADPISRRTSQFAALCFIVTALSTLAAVVVSSMPTQTGPPTWLLYVTIASSTAVGAIGTRVGAPGQGQKGNGGPSSSTDGGSDETTAAVNSDAGSENEVPVAEPDPSA